MKLILIMECPNCTKTFDKDAGYAHCPYCTKEENE